LWENYFSIVLSRSQYSHRICVPEFGEKLDAEWMCQNCIETAMTTRPKRNAPDFKDSTSTRKILHTSKRKRDSHIAHLGIWKNDKLNLVNTSILIAEYSERKSEAVVESDNLTEQEDVEDLDYDPDSTQRRSSDDEYSSPDKGRKRQHTRELLNLEPEEGWDMMNLMERKKEASPSRTSVCLSFLIIHDSRIFYIWVLGP